MTPIEAAEYWIKEESDPDGLMLKPTSNGPGQYNFILIPCSYSSSRWPNSDTFFVIG